MNLEMESSFNEPKEDVPQSKQINERTITEITNDGCIIEKKIVEYPTEETIEIEEMEEVDGKIMSVTRSIVGEKKEEPSILAKDQNKSTLSSGLKNIVIVPGHRKVEFDEKTNTTTVTEKTTTGYQQTIITVTADGNTVQTKVFYDPLPGEETCEEVSTSKPTTKKIQTKSSSTNSHVVESVISGKRAEENEKDMVRQQQEEEQNHPFQRQEHKIVKKNVHRVESNSTETTYVNDLQIVPSEMEITVSDGGKTKNFRKVARQPTEEIEIEEYEPDEFKVFTTTKIKPIVDEIEEARKDMTDIVATAQNSKTIIQDEQQEKSQIDVRSNKTSKTTIMQHRAEFKYQANVCAKVSETKTETKQSTTETNRKSSTEATQTYTKTEKIKADAYASTNVLMNRMLNLEQTLSEEFLADSNEADCQITSENSTET